MDANRFDRLARSLIDASSRRGLLRGLAAPFGLAAIRVPGSVEARKQRNKNKNRNRKKLKTNSFGCVSVGKPCQGNSANCCSDICQGKKSKKGEKDKSRCVAHDVGTCQAGQDSCSGSSIDCGVEAVCLQTTGKASFCGSGGACTECTRDTDCEEVFGSGAACVVCAASCSATGNTACIPAG